MDQSKKRAARNAAQIAFAQVLEAIPDQELTDDQRQYLWSQRPESVDAEGRLVLAYTSEAAAAVAQSNAPLTKIGRELRVRGLASGLAFEVAAAPANQPRSRGWTTVSPKERGIVYMPRFLTGTTFPHRRQPGSEFKRANGKVKLSILAPEGSGLPYGVYPRLILVHFCTAAVLTKSRRLSIGGSVNELLRAVGIRNSGGPDGTATLAREQLRRLCQTVLIYTDFRGSEGRNVPIADRWLEKDARGMHVTLSERFFAMCKISVPLDIAIVRQLRRSPLALDAYCWLTARVYNLRRETLVPWMALEAQFGAQYACRRQFRWAFRRSLAAVIQAWPAIEAEPRDRGLLIRPCQPSVVSWIERHVPGPD